MVPQPGAGVGGGGGRGGGRGVGGEVDIKCNIPMQVINKEMKTAITDCWKNDSCCLLKIEG